MVIDDQNVVLQRMTNLEEVRTILFSMNPNSTVGPGGFNGEIFMFVRILSRMTSYLYSFLLLWQVYP